jgi:uncharacterized membrane protein YfcA
VVADCTNHQFQQCVNGMCLHKDVFPLTGPEIAGIIILPLLLGFANNGGVGGGGLIIPVCIALFGFNTIQAIALSNAVICVGACVKYFGFSIRQQHPQKGTTIVDYNLCRVMLPLVLAGSFVGVIVSNILPEAILTIILVVVLFYLTYDSLNKAIGLWKKETIALEKERAAYKPLADAPKEAEMTKVQKDNGGMMVTPQAPEVQANGLIKAINSDSQEITAGGPEPDSKLEKLINVATQPGKSPSTINKEIMKPLESEAPSQEVIEAAEKIVKTEKSNLLNWKCHVLCTVELAVLFLVNLMRGSKKNPSIINIQKCGGLDWFIFITAILFYVMLFQINVVAVQKAEQIKKIAKIGTHPSDIPYHGRPLMQLVLASIGGGLAGAVGLGGGVVFNPVLIGLGV